MLSGSSLCQIARQPVDEQYVTMAKPRLLMLLHGYFPDEPRVAAEARAARDGGFEVHVIAMRRSGEAAEEVVEGVVLRRLPVEHHRGSGLLGTVREYGLFTVLAAVEAARKSGRRFDVVQVHNPPDFLVLAAVVPRLRGARILLDVHDLASDMFAMRFERLPGARTADRVLRALERWAAHRSDAVLTVHEPYRRELIKRGVAAETITVVMNSLDESLLPAEPVEERNGGFVVFYHGTVTPHYGVPLIVDAAAEAARRVPGLRVEIYGDGDAVPELERRAREYGIQDRLTVTGYVPQAEVLRAAQAASVGVVSNLPTRLNRFALSTKLLEYVALGVPVISAELPTIREHFSDDEILFFRPGDASALAAAIEQVAADPAAAASRAAAARRRYEEYRWHHSASSYLGVLRDLAERR
jgi:glycosyltransferase involved in cell wall biosynthesis